MGRRVGRAGRAWRGGAGWDGIVLGRAGRDRIGPGRTGGVGRGRVGCGRKRHWQPLLKLETLVLRGGVGWSGTGCRVKRGRVGVQWAQ